MPKKFFRPRQKTIAQLNMAKTCMRKISFGRFKVNYLIPITLLLKESNFT